MSHVKLAVLGRPGAGKTALTVRFLTQRFIGEYSSNIESVYSKNLCLDGQQLQLEIYDAGSQLQRGKLPLANEHLWADGFIVVYDISDKSSFAFAKALLYRIRDSHGGHCRRAVETTVHLVGNKQDLCHARAVDREEGRKLARDTRCQFCELSAADQAQEVQLLFTKVIRDVLATCKGRDKRRPSGSKSVAKLINNVFGKRRKSV